MADLTPPNQGDRPTRWLLAIAAAAILGTGSVWTPATAETDLFQKAIAYVFTGQVDPKNGLEIADPKSCIVVMPDPKFKRYIRYYLGRFNFDEALFDKKYSGRRVFYEMNVKGDDDVIEYLGPDKKTVLQGYRSAQISLPEDIDQARKALGIIEKHCKADKPKTPF